MSEPRTRTKYGYDLVGRRTNSGGSFARTGLPLPVSTTAYNANNQMTTWGTASLFYDLNGNMTSDGTHSYAWDERNHLSKIDSGNTASFVYDPIGRRTQKVIAGTSTSFLYDGANAVQEVIGGSNTANSLTGGVDEVFQRTDATGARSFLTDALGSTLALTDSNGALQTQYTFEPFGNTSFAGASTTNSFSYTGRELDISNLYYYRARFYNLQLQRFISEDPIGYQGNTVNLYEYAYDNPTNLTDPSGEQGIFIFLEAPPVIDPTLLEEGLRVSGGKNSLDLPDGGRLDMVGKGHIGPDGSPIPTPHVHDPLPPFDGPNWWRFPGTEDTPRPATPDDFMRGIRHNQPDPFPSDLWPGLRPAVPMHGRKPSRDICAGNPLCA